MMLPKFCQVHRINLLFNSVAIEGCVSMKLFHKNGSLKILRVV